MWVVDSPSSVQIYRDICMCLAYYTGKDIKARGYDNIRMAFVGQMIDWVAFKVITRRWELVTQLCVLLTDMFTHLYVGGQGKYIAWV